ncbi:porin [Cupriavidus sp. AU9028]|uniref:porin n=1 Tax=Cupriavidus sp. AU9028 TaxID=2871157 RepID=UPI001C986C41|nr:porin [Cupriavidus sp. AU9028]MBY4899328.1 porin [Cupriavidus sp. AU9028]
MKKSLLALAALGALAGTAHAQSSITLYGVVDVNIEYVNNVSPSLPTQPGFPGPGENKFGVTSGGLSGSRWGLRGTEDLGGGLKALFVLENGFGVDDGRQQQGGRLFGRQAYVGLESSSIGRFTFGRQYTTMFDAFANFSPTGYATQYEPIVAQLGLNFRSDNTAKYTAKFGGVTAIAHWSFGNGVAGGGEVPGQFRRDTGYGAALAYAAGPFGATIAYDQYNPTLTAGGDTGTFRKVGAAASYAFGPAKVMGGYRWGQNKNAADSTILRDDYYWAGLNYQATGALGLTLAYYYADVKNLAGTNVSNPWQVSFVADYNLSKRTDIYLTTAYTKHAGLNFDTSAISFANGYYLGAGENSMLGVAVGIRHRF